MKRLILCTAFALLATAGTAAAQTEIEGALGGGFTEPTGDFADAAKLGWHGLASFGVMPEGSPLGVQATGYYGQNKFEGGGGKWELLGLLGELKIALRNEGSLRPYVSAGGGLIDVKAKPDAGGSASDTKGALAFGIGGGYHLNPTASIFVEGRWVNVFFSGSDMNFIPVSAGVRFKLR
jgi:hypothetical protein